ncbi:MAG: broad specificity phosphatase PhoE [Oleiphilaceae bacterium]|jgi:broad specificity phosphatase PhoE
MTKRLIMVRHAERPSIPNGEVGNDVLLNASGLRASFAFGQSLAQKIIDIKTSSVSRCVQTATEIAKAVGYNTSNIDTCSDLGAPGYFISDGGKAWYHWQEKGHQRVNEFLLEGNDQWDGFHDLNEAAQQLKNKIEQVLLNSDNGTHVWITHDTILAAFTARVLEKPISLDQWPEFLGYLSIELSSSGELLFQYHQFSPVTEDFPKDRVIILKTKTAN